MSEHPSLRRLKAEEQKARAGLDQFGHALARIQRDKLYRAKGYASFAAYVEEEWNHERTWAYREIWRAEIADVLQDCNVSQAQAIALRELVYLADPDYGDWGWYERAVREVWQRAVTQHGPKPTQAQLATLVEELQTPTASAPAPGAGAEYAVTEEETRAFFGDRVGPAKQPTKEYTLMVPAERAEVFNTHIALLKREWGISSVVGVVEEALRRAAEQEGDSRSVAA